MPRSSPILLVRSVFFPGGAVAFVGGIQLKHDKMEYAPDGAMVRGEIENMGGAGATGSRRMLSTYGEFNFQPIKQLEIQAALCHDRYSDSGGMAHRS